MVCVRSAWLELPDGSTLPLEDEAAGYFCSSLDLSWPDMRAVTSSRPDQSGIDDDTRFLGGRVVSADISALVGAGAIIDAVASAFGAYMMPDNRPMLHYVLERPGNPERVIGPLRGNGYGWPIAGADQRDIQLQWVAADPYVYDTTDNTVTAWFGTPTQTGRTYNDPYYRAHGRDYGTKQEAGPTIAYMVNGGDVAAHPVLRIYGPVTAPVIYMGGGAGLVVMSSDARIDAGDYVTVDASKHLAYRGENPDDSVISWVNFQNTVWPVLPPRSNTYLYPTGQDYTHISQVSATWRDGFLS